MICKVTKSGNEDAPNYAKPLCTFTCMPREEITQDDGVTTSTVHVIDGWDRDGRPLKPQARVINRNFKGMGWVGETWGFRANILPGQSVADTLRYVIAEVGAANAKHITEYTHSGWRRIGDRWAYLYHGGAIGAEGVRVQLGEGLEEYRLDAPEGITAKAAAEWSYNVRLVLAERISVPLLAAAYLAPLREALTLTGNKPLFSVFLVGEQQSGKSVSAELAQYHFRRMSEVQFPASFYDTSNHVQSKAFKLKDSLLVVDDFHPTASIQERRAMDAMAQRLCRMKPRGRMNADGTSRVEMPPRCLSIMTGEQEPNITESGVSRLYVIEVDPKDVPKTHLTRNKLAALMDAETWMSSGKALELNFIDRVRDWGAGTAALAGSPAAASWGMRAVAQASLDKALEKVRAMRPAVSQEMDPQAHKHDHAAPVLADHTFILSETLSHHHRAELCASDHGAGLFAAAQSPAPASEGELALFAQRMRALQNAAAL